MRAEPQRCAEPIGLGQSAGSFANLLCAAQPRRSDFPLKVADVYLIRPLFEDPAGEGGRGALDLGCPGIAEHPFGHRHEVVAHQSRGSDERFLTDRAWWRL